MLACFFFLRFLLSDFTGKILVFWVDGRSWRLIRPYLMLFAVLITYVQTTVSYGTVYSPHPLPSPPEGSGWLHGYHEIFLYDSIVLPSFRNSKCNRYSLMKICLPLPTLTTTSSQLIWTVREQSFPPKLQLDCFRRSSLFSSGMIGRAKYTSARARASSPWGRFILSSLFPSACQLSRGWNFSPALTSFNRFVI